MDNYMEAGLTNVRVPAKNGIADINEDLGRLTAATA